MLECARVVEAPEQAVDEGVVDVKGHLPSGETVSLKRVDYEELETLYRYVEIGFNCENHNESGG